MSETERRKMRELDEAAEKAGGFVAFSGKDVEYDYRGISSYCKEKGIEPIDMTIRELNKFIVTEVCE